MKDDSGLAVAVGASITIYVLASLLFRAIFGVDLYRKVFVEGLSAWVQAAGSLAAVWAAVYLYKKKISDDRDSAKEHLKTYAQYLLQAGRWVAHGCAMEDRAILADGAAQLHDSLSFGQAANAQALDPAGVKQVMRLRSLNVQAISYLDDWRQFVSRPTSKDYGDLRKGLGDVLGEIVDIAEGLGVPVEN